MGLSRHDAFCPCSRDSSGNKSQFVLFAKKKLNWNRPPLLFLGYMSHSSIWLLQNLSRGMYRPPGHGMEWNGTEISVWNMKDARMEWNGRFQEWNGRRSSILPYQFHTRFRALYLEKNTYRRRVVIIILSQKYSTSISMHIICQQIAVLRFCTLHKHCTNCIIVSKLQFNCSIDVTVDDLDRFGLLFFLF